ncbi:PAS domain-containing protein, partial [Balneolaceae bacterium ANBcel3]|nr:PAS domain-containing protein [Balneolaceae bacterium ANBcel3]
MSYQEQLIPVFKNLPWPVVVLRPEAPEYLVIEGNKAFLELLSMTNSEIRNRPFLEIFPGRQCMEEFGDDSDVRQALNTVITTGKELDLSERCYYFRQGESQETTRFSCWRPVITPVFGKQNTIEYLIYTMAESTKQELDKQEKQRLAL